MHKFQNEFQHFSPPNLRFDLDKIATEMIFVVTISENLP